MKFRSTKQQEPYYTLSEAIINGVTDDNALFVPDEIPRLTTGFLSNLQSSTLNEIAFSVLWPYLDSEITEDELQTIVDNTFSFDIPLKRIHDNIYTLELFHGPTKAFKDVGARFLSRMISLLFEKNNYRERIKVLTATSGDTGGAVAHGFHKVENVDVILLFPEGKISDYQRKQMTTLGDNIYPYAVDGTFDDCQRLVKQSFTDSELQQELNLVSANSINIGRLLPQMVYYFHGLAQLPSESIQKTIFSVPSGNFGNLTAGIIGKLMGMPADSFLACVNANKVFKHYLDTGIFEPQQSKVTLSSAMDVGNPSNIERIRYLFQDDVTEIKELITSYSISDRTTTSVMSEVYQKYKYELDPHGAVGYAAAHEHLKKENEASNYIILETASPVKFPESIPYPISNIREEQESILSKDESFETIDNSFDTFKSILRKGY